MKFSIEFKKQTIGAVEFGAPESRTGLRTGLLIPTSAYGVARVAIREAIERYSTLPEGTDPEVIREHIDSGLRNLTERGLLLRDSAQREVSTTHLQILDMLPADADWSIPELARFILVAAIFPHFPPPATIGS